VSFLIASRLPTTLTLVAMATLLVVVFGALGGAVAGFRGGLLDHLFVSLTVVASSIPNFVAATAMVWLFSVRLGWFPAIGSGTGFLDTLHHLTLPATALALLFGAYVGRIARGTVISEMGRDHVEMAHARGLPHWHILRRHVLRNAMVPIATITSASVLAMVAGAVVVERVFSLDGVGSLLVEAVGRKDFAVVQAVAVILVAAFGIANVVIDLVAVALDPRLTARQT
jgi:peptide/nickel transport system permease protein